MIDWTHRVLTYFVRDLADARQIFDSLDNPPGLERLQIRQKFLILPDCSSRYWNGVRVYLQCRPISGERWLLHCEERSGDSGINGWTGIDELDN